MVCEEVKRPASLLLVGGTDPLCGAGVVADALVASLRGSWPLAVPGALVDQDSHGVYGYMPVDLGFFRRTLVRTLDDAAPAVVKVGMVGTYEHFVVVHEEVRARGLPVVWDPVTGGGTADRPRLGTSALSSQLGAAVLGGLCEGWWLTPNAQELSDWCGAPVRSLEELVEAAREVARVGRVTVVAKGGHLVQERGWDAVVEVGSVTVYEPLPWPQVDVHGTGCALATLLACERVSGASAQEAMEVARRVLAGWVQGGGLLVGGGRPQLDLRRAWEAS